MVRTSLRPNRDPAPQGYLASSNDTSRERSPAGLTPRLVNPDLEGLARPAIGRGHRSLNMSALGATADADSSSAAISHEMPSQPADSETNQPSPRNDTDLPRHGGHIGGDDREGWTLFETAVEAVRSTLGERDTFSL
jgi:hypothetical protein